MKGWFNAFRDVNDDGPTFYSFNNRTSVNGDVTVITISVIFLTLYIAFLLVFPGIRKEKLTTFLTVTLSLFVGCSILVARYGSSWRLSSIRTQTTYKAFSKELIIADMVVYIGLSHVNITLKEVTQSNDSVSDIDYNERFEWHKPYDMLNNYKEGIKKGLPFPILSIAEYFTYGDDGFCWGSKYRSAGYYTTIMLWSSFICWIFMNIFLMMVPRYSAYFMTCCGILLISAAYGYAKLIKMDPKLIIHLENHVLNFSYGWCFWIIVISGGISMISGMIISIIDWIFPNKFSTILEVDFDTPFDRHVIIEKKPCHIDQFNSNNNNYYSKVFKPRSVNQLDVPKNFNSDISSNDRNFHNLFTFNHPITKFNTYDYS